ncbi:MULTISPECIES: TetR family transcriptional regulator [unclassified Actinomadura]|uniref:TetR/AcrR family transcriptional regulator n=1 Tax=unclassified Actinomadura TaxID=2626254 RepID=UPI001F45DC10|nr:TetR family transcriptional regulator [Actinomadura sp. K4S16]
MARTGRDGGPAPEDLTARARIRDAALLQFAEHGMKGATFRGIAETAGVSVGLVQHHFGSKEELREACDAYALDMVRELSSTSGGEAMADPAFVAATVQADLPVRRYLARALVDGSEAASRMFDDLVATTERYFADPPPGVATPTTRDVRAYSAAVVAMTTGMEVLHQHLTRVLGADTFTPEGSVRLRRAVLEIFDDRLLDPEFAARAHAAMDRYEAGLKGDDDE